MKIIRHLLTLSATLAGSALIAQEAAQMSTPPPPPPPGASEPAPARESTPVDGLIHVRQLPTTAQLTKDAEAEGMTISRMEQSEDRIVVTYRYASGNTRTFAYTTVLPVDPETETSAPRATLSSPPPAPNYTVVYREPAPVIYESYPRYVTRYYDPWPTFSIGLGFGRTWGSYGGFGYYGRPHYYGGFRSHHHRSGGWRR